MVSIVIPTLFPSPKLEHYATSLSRYPTVHEVIIVVNTTGADKDENTVHWRFLGKNKGFTGACNTGAKIAKGELLLFLNDDCDMSEDALRKMVGFLEQNADVVATQPIVYKSINNYELPITNDSKEIENVGFWVDTRIGKAYPVQSTEEFSSINSQFSNFKHIQGIYQKNEIPNQVRDDTGKKWMLRQAQHDRSIYGLSGTCLFIRREIFKKIGMWDESFHSYLEDVDLAIRLQKTRYKVAPCLDAEVTHEHMATSSKMGLYKEKQDVKNWWRLIFKHPDVFIRNANIFPLLVERARNINGLFKKILRRVIYFDKLSMT